MHLISWGLLIIGSIVGPAMAQQECIENGLGQVTCGNPGAFSSEARIWMGLGLAALLVGVGGLYYYMRRRRNSVAQRQYITSPAFGRQARTPDPQSVFYPQDPDVYSPHGRGPFYNYQSEGYGLQSPQPVYGGYAPPPGVPPEKTRV
ncbi:hypothetical protein SISSUDRAFT_127870 [Sistotremastrum suecicum HHB10207 ss-3]|uniref:Uncharacterized protein n=1 Tax=Sistotremastrum suecicum HHB10207 ss-3 TaxID=1314776 RepID=A0A166AYE4_9AGAM|nr:hypothetical protein SISSUDRAFT_127870 [Sistotremastrum suecicum HHB10207 ss-3]